MNVRDWRQKIDGLLAYRGPLKRGDKGDAVEFIQGLLALAGHDPGPLDGDFGPRTDAALISWQRIGPVLRAQGVAGVQTWAALTDPLRRAFAPLPPRRFSEFGLAVAYAARLHLAERPRELGNNAGPWVRLYNGPFAERDRMPCVCGHALSHAGDGTNKEFCLKCPCPEYRPNWRLAWCAGFVSTLLYQGAEALGLEAPPIPGSLSCDVLARQAVSTTGLFHQPQRGTPAHHVVPRPGDLFLVRGETAGDWTHVGVVLEVLPNGRIRTAEGNTDSNGDRNGDALLSLARRVGNLDFICWRDS